MALQSNMISRSCSYPLANCHITIVVHATIKVNSSLFIQVITLYYCVFSSGVTYNCNIFLCNVTIWLSCSISLAVLYITALFSIATPYNNTSNGHLPKCSYII